ncbi:MAG: ATP-binding protein [Candidatus Lokiarchaeia archaeon]
MCQWCIQHGEGKKWYLNIKNYARKMYKARPTTPEMEADLARMLAQTVRDAVMKRGSPEWAQYKDQIEKLSHSIHFGQVVPLKDMKLIMDIAWPIATMTCACRRSVRGLENEKNYLCMGLGVGMYRWEKFPDTYFGGVDFIDQKEAKKWLEDLNKKGLVHSVWVFGTPYIGGVCNCEYPVCLGIRNTLDFNLKFMFKSEYVAVFNPEKCKGCKTCLSRCQFRAINWEVSGERPYINMFNCFGCGLCATACPNNAIHLEERSKFPALKNDF